MIVLLATAVLGIAVAACGPTLRRPAHDDYAVRVEQERQQALAIAAEWQRLRRLDAIAGRMRMAASGLCAETTWWSGFRLADLYSYGDFMPSASRRAGLSEVPELNVVVPGSPTARAGLKEGDSILSINGARPPLGKKAVGSLMETIIRAYRSADPSLRISVLRGVRTIDTVVTPEVACSHAVDLARSAETNAFADGVNVFVTTGMMRFATDGELAFIVGHELAHNVLGHIDATRTNSLIGALLGGVIEGLTGAYGMTDTGAARGGLAFSQDFEAEADYLGLYLHARAGYDIDAAKEIWRKLAIESPANIDFALTHPTTAERFVALDVYAKEIRRKQAAGRTWAPEGLR